MRRLIYNAMILVYRRTVQGEAVREEALRHLPQQGRGRPWPWGDGSPGPGVGTARRNHGTARPTPSNEGDRFVNKASPSLRSHALFILRYSLLHVQWHLTHGLGFVHDTAVADNQIFFKKTTTLRKNQYKIILRRERIS